MWDWLFSFVAGDAALLDAAKKGNLTRVIIAVYELKQHFPIGISVLLLLKVKTWQWVTMCVLFLGHETVHAGKYQL